MKDYRNWAIGLLTAMLLAFGGVFWSQAQTNAAMNNIQDQRLAIVETTIHLELKNINTRLDRIEQLIQDNRPTSPF